MQENGIYDQLVKQHMFSSSTYAPIIRSLDGDKKDNQVEYQVLNVENFKDIFFLLCFGMFATIVVTLSEIIYHQYKKTNKV